MNLLHTKPYYVTNGWYSYTNIYTIENIYEKYIYLYI
ncbi:unnamed protein product [Brassica rapa subsp. trilocularis]